MADKRTADEAGLSDAQDGVKVQRIERATTIQQTLDDAKRFLGETPEPEQAANEPHHSSIQRATTIQQTVKDAQHILGDEPLKPRRENAGSDSQDSAGQSASAPRASTIDQTLAAAKKILGDQPLTERHAHFKDDEATNKADGGDHSKNANFQRATTIEQTLEASKRILGEGELGSRRADAPKSPSKDAPVSPSKEAGNKSPIHRSTTIDQTLADAEKILGKDAKSDSDADASPVKGSPKKRGAAAAKKDAPAKNEAGAKKDTPPKGGKRATTMDRTVEEGKKILGRDPLPAKRERRTRSNSTNKE